MSAAQGQARIAIVAVHGVADQKPFETARSVATLLHGVASAPAGYVGYGEFVEAPLQVPVSPVVRAARAPADSRRWRRWLSVFRSAYRNERVAGGAAADAQPDFSFMESQLRDYDAARDPPAYQTLRLSAERSARELRPGQGAVEQRARVDVYELYWADLSRLGSGLLRILGELYQLLFHVSSLGRLTVDLALGQNPRSRSWRALASVQTLANATLTLPVAILNLYLLLVTVLLAVVLVPLRVGAPDYRLLGAQLAWGVLGLVLGAWWAYRATLRPACGKALLTVLCGAAAVMAVALVDHSQQISRLSMLAMAVLLLLALVAAWALRVYERRRPGAWACGRIAGAPVLAFMIYKLPLLAVAGGPVRSGERELVHWVGNTAEWIFILLGGAWVLLFALQVLAFALGEWAARDVPPPAAAGAESPRQSARRAVWTGRIALFVPTATFLVLTLALWSMLLAALRGRLSALNYESFRYGGHHGEVVPVEQFIADLIAQSGGPAFNLFLGLVALAVVLLVWGLLPAVLAEALPPRGADALQTRRLGHGLDYGFRLAAWAGWVMLAAAVFVLPLSFVGAALYEAGRLGPTLSAWYDAYQAAFRGNVLLSSAGLALGGSAVGVVALGSRLGKVFLGFRGALDVALDVDNWLREHPLDANPKSRICARYASLLRFIERHRDGEGRGYQAVVIVAHSQGTVISADLLRFLRTAGRGHPPVSLPVYLLTLGSPLRQLYGLRFPHLYGWARHDEGPAASRRPAPDELAVELWVNAYRSGDYVGRYLWRADGDGERYTPIDAGGVKAWRDAPTLAAARRLEFCLGPGAHTHYFDTTAPRIGEAIDQLIAVALAGKAGYAHPFPTFGG